jgi:nucleoside-diphosphate-sugar epimerase
VQADIALARKVLRWEPQTPFEKGLVETARWAKSEFSASMRAPVLAAGA